MADTPAVIVELLDNGYTPSEIGRVFRDWGALLALGIGPDEWAQCVEWARDRRAEKSLNGCVKPGP